MDLWLVGLWVFGLLLATLVLVRAIGTLERLAEARLETQRLKATWYQQMAKLNPKKGGKPSKKSRKDQEDDDEEGEGDEIDELAALMDRNPMVAGVVEGIAKQNGVDLDRVFDRDPAELRKAQAVLQRISTAAAPANGAAGAAWQGQLPPPL